MMGVEDATMNVILSRATIGEAVEEVQEEVNEEQPWKRASQASARWPVPHGVTGGFVMWEEKGVSQVIANPAYWDDIRVVTCVPSRCRRLLASAPVVVVSGASGLVDTGSKTEAKKAVMNRSLHDLSQIMMRHAEPRLAHADELTQAIVATCAMLNSDSKQNLVGYR